MGYPGLSGGELGKRRDVAVSDGDGDGNAGVGEGAKYVGVGIEYFDAVDVGLGFEESGYTRRRWEVVSDGAVVDTDGIRGGAGENGSEGEKEEEGRVCHSFSLTEGERER